MRPETIGMIIGGLVPCVLFGFVNLFARMGAQDGINAGHFMFLAGIGVAVAGAVFSLTQPQALPMTGRTMVLAMLYGAGWSLGSGCIMFSLLRYRVPIAKLVPLFNMNTLVAVALTVVIFAEWKLVHLTKLILGSIFVVIGGILVALA